METVSMIAVAIFFIYIRTAVYVFKCVPASISDTYYMYENKHKGLGIVFTLFMVTVGFMLTYPFMCYSNSTLTTILSAFCSWGIIFCGCASCFKEELTKTVHFVGAYTAAATGLAWCFIINWLYTLSILNCIAFIIIVCANFTESFNKKHRTFWLEILCFGTVAIFIAIKVIFG